MKRLIVSLIALFILLGCSNNNVTQKTYNLYEHVLSEIEEDTYSKEWTIEINENSETSDKNITVSKYLDENDRTTISSIKLGSNNYIGLSFNYINKKQDKANIIISINPYYMVSNRFGVNYIENSIDKNGQATMKERKSGYIHITEEKDFILYDEVPYLYDAMHELSVFVNEFVNYYSIDYQNVNLFNVPKLILDDNDNSYKNENKIVNRIIWYQSIDKANQPSQEFYLDKESKKYIWRGYQEKKLLFEMYGDLKEKKNNYYTIYNQSHEKNNLYIYDNYIYVYTNSYSVNEINIDIHENEAKHAEIVLKELAVFDMT